MLAGRRKHRDMGVVEGGAGAALLAGVRPMGTIPHAAIIIAGDTVRVAQTFDEIMDDDVPGFWETNGYHNHGDPWKEERYW